MPCESHIHVFVATRGSRLCWKHISGMLSWCWMLKMLKMGYLHIQQTWSTFGIHVECLCPHDKLKSSIHFPFSPVLVSTNFRKTSNLKWTLWAENQNNQLKDAKMELQSLEIILCRFFSTSDTFLITHSYSIHCKYRNIICRELLDVRCKSFISCRQWTNYSNEPAWRELKSSCREAAERAVGSLSASGTSHQRSDWGFLLYNVFREGPHS